jgi:glycosyltransferase involved in cell wall biosynthesis
MTKRIRVLQVTNSLNLGGLEKLVVDLCLHVDRERFEPSIACISREGTLAEEARAAGIQVHLLAGDRNAVARYTSSQRLKALIREQQIDVVHTHNSGPIIDALFARATQLRRLAVVHTDHTRPDWPDRKHRMVLERIAARVFGGIVAVSEDARNKLHEYEKIPLEQIQIIDNGIDVARFSAPSKSSTEWLTEIKAEHFAHRIGVVAMHRAQKGHAHLLNAMPLILKQHPNTGLIVAGGGPLEQQLKAQTRALGIEPNVRFIGKRSDIVDVLWGLDIFVLPSASEGLPIALLEAMAARRCIVSTAVGAIPHVLDHGACGELIPPLSPEHIADAVNRLLDDGLRRQQLGDAALERVSRSYSIAATIRKYEELYERRLADLQS